jgi:hypothetical protein
MGRNEMEEAMPGKAVAWGTVLVAFAALHATWSAHAEESGNAPTYKCWRRGEVMYSQLPCAGGKPIGGTKPRVNVRYETPPQDRAKAARRGMLTAEAREECTALDARLHSQEQELKIKGPAATLQDEMPLVQSKKRYRELKC